MRPPVFRPLNSADAPAVAELEHTCFTVPWTLAQIRGALAQNNFATFGLFAQNELVAYASFYHARPDMEIVNLAVAQGCRRQGLGKRILGLLLQVARKMGMQKVSLEVRESNVAAISLYRQAGFGLTGRRRAYYPDTGEDGLIMTLEFPSKCA